ncbi:hypothetical protein Rhe02_47220 [Rhizocola hellebori]|uniref:Uncharacterized protein n=1 Tax=Rhizocola hellebori TaxID=1392758 RepID=A0A8J3VHM3_9ACTN|nr:hypothetical protein [Rhizocola hellebori]GIH06655.1 hypothetical protein Rhe02_47220 [Rhizocola hellebori]
MATHDTDSRSPRSVTWRVTKWEKTEDWRWRIAAFSDHPLGNWSAALAVARAWLLGAIDEVENGQLRIKVDPMDM